MRCLSLIVMLLLGACMAAPPPPADPSIGGIDRWHFRSGKPPTHAEYAALVAACQDGVVTNARGKPLESCLIDLGLRRSP